MIATNTKRASSNRQAKIKERIEVSLKTVVSVDLGHPKRGGWSESLRYIYICDNRMRLVLRVAESSVIVGGGEGMHVNPNSFRFGNRCENWEPLLSDRISSHEPESPSTREDSTVNVNYERRKSPGLEGFSFSIQVFPIGFMEAAYQNPVIPRVVTVKQRKFLLPSNSQSKLISMFAHIISTIIITVTIRG